MKNLIFKLLLISFTAILISNKSFSQTPTYTLTATNFNRTAADSITFDIYILHTNPGVGIFNFALGQYFFNFNPAIANGGTLTYRIIGSELPPLAQPRNPSISGNQLRLLTNVTLGGNGPTISSTAPGTLVVRMSLRTTAPALNPDQNINLQWRNAPEGNPFTKIFAYVGTISTDITNGANHFIDDPVSVNQISSVLPSEYKLSQNYPNPFNPVTKINFSLPKPGNVSLKVYDVSGRIVATLVNEKLGSGVFEFEFKGEGLSSGLYFYRISAEGNGKTFNATKKMMLVK